MSGRYSQAIESFQQILEYPQPHQLKDNAQYWLAECYYAQKKYIRALAEFQKVKENFPKASKAFDAELKIAYTYHKMGSIEECKQKLSQLSKDWTHEQYQSKIAVLSEKLRERD
jgi:TolA-binding protein